MFFQQIQPGKPMAAALVVAVLGAVGAFWPNGRAAGAITNSPLPTAPAYQSTNWAGYADVVSSSGYAFTLVSGDFTVPKIKAPAGSSSMYSAFWVGLDGFNSNTVEQTGVLAQTSNGITQYYAWYEMYPGGLITFNNLTINPGDKISTEVSYDGSNNYTLTIHDLTSGKGDSTTQSSTSPDARSSAEWIAEAPTIQSYNGTQSISTLGKFGAVTFAKASGVKIPWEA
jgi:hypothetical protein